MARQLAKIQEWEVFLKTLTGISDLSVSSVTQDAITFTTGSASIHSVLNDPNALKSVVIHAFSSAKTEEVTVTLNPNLDLFNEILSYSGNEMLMKLVDSNFLAGHRIDIASANCEDNTLAKVVTCAINKEGTKTVLFKQQQVNIGYLQSMLQDSGHLSEILLGAKPALGDEDFTGEDSAFGQSVVSVRQTSAHSAVMQFNYGYILQALQVHLGYGAPVVAMDTDVDTQQQFIVDRNALLNYAHEVFPSGVLFAKTSGASLQPVMFQPISANLSHTFDKLSFEILLDRSGSMTDVFPAFKNEVVNIMQQITNATDSYEITVTAFNHEHSSRTFNSNSSDFATIEPHVNGLQAGGGTCLHNVMYDKIRAVAADTSANSNNVLVVFTDGKDEGCTGSRPSQDIVDIANSARVTNPQFLMVVMSYGPRCDDAFFNKLSSTGGFKHMSLSNIAEVEGFVQDIDTINNCRVVYTFENGVSKFFGQCSAGDVALSGSVVSADATVVVDHIPYAIGYEFH